MEPNYFLKSPKCAILIELKLKLLIKKEKTFHLDTRTNNNELMNPRKNNLIPKNEQVKGGSLNN